MIWRHFQVFIYKVGTYPKQSESVSNIDPTPDTAQCQTYAYLWSEGAVIFQETVTKDFFILGLPVLLFYFSSLVSTVNQNFILVEKDQ